MNVSKFLRRSLSWDETIRFLILHRETMRKSVLCTTTAVRCSICGARSQRKGLRVFTICLKSRDMRSIKYYCGRNSLSARNASPNVFSFFWKTWILRDLTPCTGILERRNNCDDKNSIRSLRVRKQLGDTRERINGPAPSDVIQTTCHVVPNARYVIGVAFAR